MAETIERATPDPVLTRRVRIAEITLITVIGLAAATELFRLIALGAPVGGYLAVATAVAGTAVGRRHPATGLALTELFRRLDNPRLVVDPPPYRRNPFLRGPSHLRIAFDGVGPR